MRVAILVEHRPTVPLERNAVLKSGNGFAVGVLGPAPRPATGRHSERMQHGSLTGSVRAEQYVDSVAEPVPPPTDSVDSNRVTAFELQRLDHLAALAPFQWFFCVEQY